MHLDEAVYMRLPAGFEGMSSEVVLLQRTVYGLRQVGRQWSLRPSRMLLKKTGIEQSKTDLRLFRKVMEVTLNIYMCVCVYVDGLAVTAKDKETFDVFLSTIEGGISCE